MRQPAGAMARTGWAPAAGPRGKCGRWRRRRRGPRRWPAWRPRRAAAAAASATASAPCPHTCRARALSAAPSVPARPPLDITATSLPHPCAAAPESAPGLNSGAERRRRLADSAGAMQTGRVAQQLQQGRSGDDTAQLWHPSDVAAGRLAAARRRRKRGAPVDGGAEEDEVGPQQPPDDRQRDGGRLVDHQQLRLRQALVVLRLDVLHRLRAPARAPVARPSPTRACIMCTVCTARGCTLPIVRLGARPALCACSRPATACDARSLGSAWRPACSRAAAPAPYQP